MTLGNGKPVHVWPDSSGKGRNLSITAGVRPGGVRHAATFIAESNGRPAIRFGPDTGLASSPQLPVDIHGDAALVGFVLVMNLQPNKTMLGVDIVVGVGNPRQS